MPHFFPCRAPIAAVILEPTMATLFNYGLVGTAVATMPGRRRKVRTVGVSDRMACEGPL